MYDSIQAVLTSQLRYRAQWNESTAAKTVMSYQSRIVPRQRTVIGVDEAVEPRSRSRRDNSRFDRPPRAVVTAISCTMERKHSYENGDVIPESRIVPKHGDRCEAVAEVEIAPRCPALRHRESSREAASGRSHVYHRAKHATGISLAVGIVPKAHTGAHGARRRTV